MNFAVLDIETTGGSPKHEKITEIAIYIHNGQEVINEFSSLINPEKAIPYFITSLTGITNEMVADAPRFYEVARQIVELTDNCIVVGHNVNFDYGFIREEFRQLGFDYQRKTLCTLKLSRKFLPGYKSYSLGKICEQLAISINGRHRATGDAFATVRLFEILLEKNSLNGNSLPLMIKPEGRLKNLNGFLKPEDISEIPAATGVYYLHDSEGNLIYVGKSKNIHSRVLSHLGNKNSRRSTEMSGRIAGISYELTGNELIALLKESEEIKKFKPRYNRAQRRSFTAWGLYSHHDEQGYLNFRICKTASENKTPHITFNNGKQGREWLSEKIKKHWLCQKLSGMYQTEGACFHYSIRQCNGACVGAESKTVYNARAGKLIESLEYDDENILIIDKGRTDSERSVVLIENGLYKGFGFLDISETYLQIEDLKACITVATDTREIRQIISGYTKKNKIEKIIKF